MDFESETFVTHALRAEGFDGSEDGTVRRTPIVPVLLGSAFEDEILYGPLEALHFACECGCRFRGEMDTQCPVCKQFGGGTVTYPESRGGEPLIPLPFDTTQITSATNRSKPKPGDPSHPLASSAHPPAIAFSSKDHGTDAGELAPTLRSMGHKDSHANGGGQVAVAFNPQAAGKQTTLGANTDSASAVSRSQIGGVAQRSGVRRLMPIETERLQGFPDGFTEGFADGVRYKMHGNAVCVPCAEWLGQRIRASVPACQPPSH